MLQSIRDRATGWIAWVIVIFISIPFALWGVQEYAGVGGPVVAANVNGTEIPLRTLQEGMQRERARLQRMLGDAASQFVSDDALRERVLKGMIDAELRRQGAYSAGFRVGDARVAVEIDSIEAFKRDGVFDQQLYDRVLRSNNYSPTQFEEQLRGDLMTNQLVEGVVATAFATGGETDEFLRLREQTRDFRYLVINADDVGEVAVSDEAVTKEYEANRSLFMEPEQVKVEYLELKLESLMAAVTVDEAALESLYEEQKGRFLREEERRASHILLALEEGADQAADDKVRAEAMSLYERIRDGEDFAALAREHSKDPGSAEQGGDLGFFGKGVMVGPFEEAVFSMAVGAVSEPVRTAFGYHIIRVDEVKEGEVKGFAEVRGEVEKEYRRREAEGLFIEQVEQLTTIAFESPTSLSAAAEALELKVEASDWFSRDAGEGVAAEAKVRAAAFEEDVLEGGNNSVPVELSNDRVVVVRRADRKPAAAKPLADVRAEIVEQLKARGAREAARAKGEAILKAARDGGDLASLAGDAGRKLNELTGVRRDGAQGGIGEIVGALFRVARPADGAVAFEGVALRDGGFAVIELFAAADGEPTALSAVERRSEGQALARGAGEVEFSDVMEGLRARADIEIAKIPTSEER